MIIFDSKIFFNIFSLNFFQIFDENAYFHKNAQNFKNLKIFFGNIYPMKGRNRGRIGKNG